MTDDSIQKKTTENSSSNESDAKLDSTQDAFIHDADKRETKERGFASKTYEHLKEPTGFLEIAGVVILFLSAAANFALWLAQLHANGINQQSLVDANRAFIYFKPTQFIGDAQDNTKFIIIVPMGNSGNTPTRNLTYQKACFPSYKINSIFINKNRQKSSAAPASIGPKVEVTPIACGLTMNKDGSVKDQNGDSARTFVVIGFANYRDILERKMPHVTEFCYSVTDIKSSGGTANLNAESQPCAEYNCADNECKTSVWPFPA